MIFLSGGWGIHYVGTYRLSTVELRAALRLGYARPVCNLLLDRVAVKMNTKRRGWIASLNRDLLIQRQGADELCVGEPREKKLVLLQTDVLPYGSFGLKTVSDSCSIFVKPWNGDAWQAPSQAEFLVTPAVYPADGRIAYYDLGRIWISDLDGFKMQSLEHVPLLSKGGEILWDYGGTRLCWIGNNGQAAAVDLTFQKTKSALK